ncbi:helix-turn-helix transcriptional regulator [bacterium]|nr:helix-turn-helix transcriptional regulator [bacterium]
MRSVQATLQGLGCSYAHAGRVFRETYGISPVEYMNAIRIERARLFLRDTDLSISEAAYRVGFSSAAYFSRLFKRLTGLSPREFRESQREAAS